MSKIHILKETLQATYLMKLLNKMYKYEIDPTRTLGATERTCDAGQMDGRTDRRTDGVKLIYPPPTTLLCGVYNKAALWLSHLHSDISYYGKITHLCINEPELNHICSSSSQLHFLCHYGYSYVWLLAMVLPRDQCWLIHFLPLTGWLQPSQGSMCCAINDLLIPDNTLLEPDH